MIYIVSIISIIFGYCIGCWTKRSPTKPLGLRIIAPDELVCRNDLSKTDQKDF